MTFPDGQAGPGIHTPHPRRRDCALALARRTVPRPFLTRVRLLVATALRGS